MLSIIVPIYKIEEYLTSCIESIITQSYKNFELILIDDGSSDNCSMICDNYAQIDSRIRVIHKLNKGLVSARKTGLLATQYEYIGYVDGDDWIQPDYYEKLMDIAIEYGAEIIASGFLKAIGNNYIEKKSSISPGFYNRDGIVDRIIPNMMFDPNSMEPGLFTYVWNKLFKKNILLKSQMNVDDSISLGEDAACVYPAVCYADSIYLDNNCLYNYRQRADSMLKVSDSYKEDYVGYQRLYSHLKNEVDVVNAGETQLQRFLLYLVTTRCGGYNSDNGQFFLYERQPVGNRIAVYGAGTLGQHLVKRLSFSDKYAVIKWVDEDYQILKTHELNVDSPETICQMAFTDVIIAFLDKDVVLQTKKKLLDKGIPEEKIICTDFLNVNCNLILRQLGVIQDDDLSG